MKKYVFLFAACCLAILVFYYLNGCMFGGHPDTIDLDLRDPLQCPYGFVAEYFENNKNHYYAIDYEGDGISEIMVLDNKAGDSARIGESIIIKDLENQTIACKSFDGVVTLYEKQEDLNGDSFKEICFTEYIDDMLLLYVWDAEHDKLYSAPVAFNEFRSSRKWVCNGWPIGFRDLTHDGIKDVILCVITQWAYFPRFIIAYDWYNKKKIWRYDMGAAMSHAYIFDVDHDGQEEIVAGTRSPNNGEDAIGVPYVIGETSDDKNYFLVLDMQGHAEVVEPIGVAYDNVIVYPFDWKGDSTLDAMILHMGVKRDSIPGWLAPWDIDAASFAPKIKIEGETPIRFLDVDRNGDSVCEYLVCWKNGHLRLYDQSLHMIDELYLPNVHIDHLIDHDILGTPEKEVVCIGRYADNRITLVFDKDLNLLAYQNIFSTPLSFFYREHGEPPITFGEKNGEKYFISLKKQPLYFLPFAGNPKSFGLGALATVFAGLLVMLFIRPRYRLHDMRAIFNTLYHNEGTGYFLLEREGNIRTVNPLLLEWLGRPVANVTRREYRDALRDTGFSWLSPHLDQFNSDGLDSTIFEHQSTDNRYYVVKLIVMPFPVFFARMILVVIEDVSEFVQSKRSVAWASMAQKLAHEIKTPLSTVLLSAQQIGEDSPSGKYVQHIREQVERLQSLTEDMLKFAHIEKPRLERVILNKLVQQALIDLRLQIGSMVTVETDLGTDLPVLQGDPHQLQIALKNCISNSLTAMQGRGTLTIRTHLLSPPGSFKSFGPSLWSEIEIMDTGRGMTREELDMLFQPFFSHSPKGTGLGMVIVKKIIDDHRGTISVQSREGAGTRITITLPGVGYGGREE